MKKTTFSTVTALTLCLSVISVSPIFAQASEGESAPTITYETEGNLEITNFYYDEPVDYDFEIQDDNRYSASYIPHDGKEYKQTTKTLYKKKSWGTEISNRSSLNDSVTRSVSRSKFANGSIGAAAETAVNWKLIQGKVGITGEASWGKSSTVNVSYTINLPAKQKTVVAIGTKAVQTKGKVVTYKSGRITKSTVTNADYSYDEYVDKKSTPL